MLDLAVSFTASRALDHGGKEAILNVLTMGIPLCRSYLTGGADGGDAFIGAWLFEHRPEAEHVVVVPANHSQVDPWWHRLPWHSGEQRNLTIIQMPRGTTYKDRNAELVSRGDAVCAFPAYPENDRRSLRSGTWQTARLARGAGNFCRWDCVTPPYHGKIEKPLGEFMREMQDG